MNSKVTDRIATSVFVLLASIIVIILAGLFSFILFRGIPEISWDFLTSESSAEVLEGEYVINFLILFMFYSSLC